MRYYTTSTELDVLFRKAAGIGKVQEQLLNGIGQCYVFTAFSSVTDSVPELKPVFCYF